MATLDELKQALRQRADTIACSAKQPLTEKQYDVGFEIFSHGLNRTAYEKFVLPQLTKLLALLLESRVCLSILEVGPGPDSILAHLPGWIRRRIGRYAAFEPNGLFATRLEQSLQFGPDEKSPLPALAIPASIRRSPFDLDTSNQTGSEDEMFDVVLFCHSMYGMKPTRMYIERALEMLHDKPEDGMVIVFHRKGNLDLDGLVCHRTASLPTGTTRVADDDRELATFARFIAGFTLENIDEQESVRTEWRKTCRTLGHHGEINPGYLLFDSPEVMVTLNRNAAKVSDLVAQIPETRQTRRIRNREAHDHRPPSMVTPKDVGQVQQCVQWALSNKLSLTVVGGSHSGQCTWPNVVAVDMSAFNQVHVVNAGKEVNRGVDATNLVVVEAGCTSGDVIRKTMEAGVTVPLGARPSVGAGLWLQGGIGHLARLHGLACDSIVGAVVVGLATGEILCVGNVPKEHQPEGTIHPENGEDLLWALRGAGTNFGIVISVTFQAYPDPKYSIRNWVIPINDQREARSKLSDLDRLVAKKLPRNRSMDAYLFWEDDKLRLGVSTYEVYTGEHIPGPSDPMLLEILGPENSSQTVNSVGLFETEMYMSGMHGGHSSGKTSSFKRCVFLKDIGGAEMVDLLVAALESRPAPRCYLHLLQGGGAVSEVAEDATAFGCRNWDFACVITGVWPRDQDGSDVARKCVQWVYHVATTLLPWSGGVYGADLGPDPRDAVLAARAFGNNNTNLPRLSRLKRRLDPDNVLAYACPLPKAPSRLQLIVLVTGHIAAGKDFFADNSADFFATSTSLKARVFSISDATKREYAEITGASFTLLLKDRAYKEQHRPALTSFFQDQVKARPRLPEEHFLDVVNQGRDADVLFITGMRDEAPVAAFSHLVPGTRVIEVNVRAPNETKVARGGSVGPQSDSPGSHHCPDLIFNNEMTGTESTEKFCEDRLLPFFHEDLQKLHGMVRSTPNFPRRGIEFRDVLGISEQSDGLSLCTSLLQSHFAGDWAKIDRIACCGFGGILFASALGSSVNVPLALIRERGKRPPPNYSVSKSTSHISSSSAPEHPKEDENIEMCCDAVAPGAAVVVVDDVLATGETLCAVLRLLRQAGVVMDSVSVMVVAEFPVHRGRALLRRNGFGGVRVQSLLVFEGE